MLHYTAFFSQFADRNLIFTFMTYSHRIIIPYLHPFKHLQQIHILLLTQSRIIHIPEFIKELRAKRTQMILCLRAPSRLGTYKATRPRECVVDVIIFTRAYSPVKPHFKNRPCDISRLCGENLGKYRIILNPSVFQM